MLKFMPNNLQSSYPLQSLNHINRKETALDHNIKTICKALIANREKYLYIELAFANYL